MPNDLPESNLHSTYPNPDQRLLRLPSIACMLTCCLVNQLLYLTATRKKIIPFHKLNLVTSLEEDY